MAEITKHNFKKILIYSLVVILCLILNFLCLRTGSAQLGIDYATFYTTGKMVLSGDISNIYDFRIHHALLESRFGSIPYLLEWIYPPTFLTPIVPLSVLPFQISLAVWLILTFIPAAVAAYFLSNRNKLAPFAYLMFPGTFLNIRWGQNGFLTASLIGFGVYFAETNPVLSGLMLGLLTFKPQMALIPFAVLFFLKKWKTLGWSCAFASIFAVFSGIIFGFDTWASFFATSSVNATMLADSWKGTKWGIPTLSTSLRCMGLSGWPLYSILAAVAALALYACIRVWKQTKSFSLRASALVFCIFLSLPYISLYDFAIVGIPFALLFTERLKNVPNSFHPFIIDILWLMPVMCLAIFINTEIQLCPFLLMGFLAAIVYRTEKESEPIMIREAIK